MRKVKCPDGPKYIYRNPANAFPITLKNISTNIQGAVEGLQSASANASVEHRREIQTLLIQLDESNRSMQADFAAAYTAFASDPCHDPGYLQRRVNELQSDRQHITQLLIQVRLIEHLLTTGAPSNEIAEVVKQAILAAQPPHVAKAHAAIAEAPTIVEKWAAP
jgi:hypothetical protein